MSLYRIMAVDECGTEVCIKNDIRSINAAETQCANARENYPEWRGFHIEHQRDYYAEAMENYDNGGW